MKVKELKNILNGCNDDFEVVIGDTAGQSVQIVGGGEVTTNGFLFLWVRQEFPFTWFDKDGGEFRWVNGKKVVPKVVVEESDISLTHRDLFNDDDEHIYSFKFYDGYAVCLDHPGIRLTYPKVGDLTDEQIEEIDEYVGGRCADSGVVVPNDVALLYGEVQYDGIMDTGNGHSEGLVKEINRKWLKFHDKFKPILVALYERDIDEITDSDAFQIPSWLNTEECAEGKFSGDWDGYHKMALADMTTRWDEFANNYLMHIADDQDLEAIIKFVRYDVCEDERHS